VLGTAVERGVRGPEGREATVAGACRSGRVRPASAVDAHPLGDVVTGTADVARVVKTNTSWADFCDKCVFAAVVGQIRAAGHRERSRRRVGHADHIRATGTVDGETVALIAARAADEPRVHQARAAGIDLGHEGVASQGSPEVEGQVWSDLHGVIERLGAAGDVGVAGSVDRDVSWLLEPRTADVAEVVERSAPRVDLADIAVHAAAIGQARADGDWEALGGVRSRGPADVPGDVEVAGGVWFDAADVVLVARAAD